MPSDAAPPDSPPAPEEEFPADLRTLSVAPAAMAAGGIHSFRFHLANPRGDGVLHVRLQPDVPWVKVTPDEAALGPGERQPVRVEADLTRGRVVAQSGGPPVAAIQLLHQRLFPGSARPPVPAAADAVYLRLPVARCPSCERTLDADLADGTTVPEVCPYCYERLRPCPVCGAPNTWLARRCHADDAHTLRASPDWPMLGGEASHAGSRPERFVSLSRRWSVPSVAPTRRETILDWSAPVAAYGLVAAAAAAADGEAHLYAYDALKGAPLWEPYPLSDPVYPERGGAVLAGGKLAAASVEGIIVALDALRGTRLWEQALPGRVYGALSAAGDGGPLLAAVARPDATGALLLLDLASGAIRGRIDLPGVPDAAPASDGLRAFVHDDSGTLTAADLATGQVLWSTRGGAGFDASPVVVGERVFSADSEGVARALDVSTGKELWRQAVTNAPFAGTPACDGTLLYLPAADGLHLVSAATGKAVRRYGTSRPIRSAPVVLAGAVLFGLTDGSIYGALPGRAVEKLYETGGTGSQIVAAPAVADGALFLAATNGVLYALALAGG